MINIIDLKKPQIFSFDSEGPTYTKIFLPLADYNITSLLRHTCDQDNNVLQVIGCTENQNDCKLITYRADLAHKPYSRVHSIIDMPSKDGQIFTNLASSINDENDDTITVVISENLESMSLYQIEIDGPHIRLGAEKVLDAGQYTIDWTVNVPGKVAETFNVTEYFNLTLQKPQIEVDLIKKDSKAPHKERIDLEDFIEVTGPFHSVGTKQIEGITLIDRLTPSTQLASVTTTFDDSVFHKDYVFGYKADGAITSLTLVQGEKVIFKVDDAPASRVFIVEKSKTEYYFFAYVKRLLADDQLYVVYTKDDGQIWKSTSETLSV